MWYTFCKPNEKSPEGVQCSMIDLHLQRKINRISSDLAFFVVCDKWNCHLFYFSFSINLTARSTECTECTEYVGCFALCSVAFPTCAIWHQVCILNGFFDHITITFYIVRGPGCSAVSHQFHYGRLDI